MQKETEEEEMNRFGDQPTRQQGQQDRPVAPAEILLLNKWDPMSPSMNATPMQKSGASLEKGTGYLLGKDLPHMTIVAVEAADRGLNAGDVPSLVSLQIDMMLGLYVVIVVLMLGELMFMVLECYGN
ncbi:hypothetical protein NDU88_000571 [Pleurodeles waltl]|uniref:Uncharacterized protein n=1 Tax=Pleurodeles waltl TaxID=8319 RepID=A0AAV7L8I9_PLEWA|nr:hypothetical protein NDU88_000571 [Pleurodeles waltl]